MKRPPDIEEAIKQQTIYLINTFDEADIHSGYAKYMAVDWAAIPKSMSNEDARVYLGLKPMS
jgi:hypothetical protein